MRMTHWFEEEALASLPADEDDTILMNAHICNSAERGRTRLLKAATNVNEDKG